MVERNKDMLTIIIIVFLIILAVIVGISFKLYDYALNPKVQRKGFSIQIIAMIKEKKIFGYIIMIKKNMYISILLIILNYMVIK